MEQPDSTMLANALITKAHDIIGKLRSIDNSMKGVTESCIGKSDITEDEWRLTKDVYLRIRKLNNGVSTTNPSITAAMAIEVWHAFLTSNDVSFATIGIRDDLKRNTTMLLMENENVMCIDHFLKPEVSSQKSTFSFAEFTEWVKAFCDGEYEMEVNYFSKFHHCRWTENCEHPKLNCCNVGASLGKTSSMLRSIHRTCPSGVSCVGQGDSSFGVDKTLDDMLIIIEEVPNFLFTDHITNGNHNKNDSVNMMRSRLTTGVSNSMRFFVNETNNQREMICTQTSAQGNYLMATTKDPITIDKHVLSRFLVITHNQHNEESEPRKEISDYQLAQHRDLHRVYYIVECMVKANVVKMDTEGARIMLNDMQFGNSRKRNNVFEMARILCIASVVWRVMMSPAFSHLQYHPQSAQYIGLNVRVLVEGIFPLLIVSKQMIAQALWLVKF